MPNLNVRMSAVRYATTLVLFIAVILASACSKKDEEAPRAEEPAKAATGTPSEVKH